ncbi:insulin receptor-like [Palaemon carinicauda]|uniref:insulin receptor-like n=1 Tax=Palaemon carinicauda TaxID=392227 RepID=UPI0035B66C23
MKCHMDLFPATQYSQKSQCSFGLHWLHPYLDPPGPSIYLSTVPITELITATDDVGELQLLASSQGQASLPSSQEEDKGEDQASATIPLHLVKLEVGTTTHQHPPGSSYFISEGCTTFLLSALSQSSISPHPSCAFGELRKYSSTSVTLGGKECRWSRVNLELEGSTRIKQIWVESKPTWQSCPNSLVLKDFFKHTTKGPSLLTGRSLSDFRINSLSFMAATDDSEYCLPVVYNATEFMCVCLGSPKNMMASEYNGNEQHNPMKVKTDGNMSKKMVVAKIILITLHLNQFGITLATMTYKCCGTERKDNTKKENMVRERMRRQTCLPRRNDPQNASDNLECVQFLSELQKMARTDGFKKIRELKRENIIRLTRLCYPNCFHRPKTRKSRVEVNFRSTKLFPKEIPSLPSVTESEPYSQETRLHCVPNECKVVESKTTVTLGQLENGKNRELFSESVSKSKGTVSDLQNSMSGKGNLSASETVRVKDTNHKSRSESLHQQKVQKHNTKAVYNNKVFVSMKTKVHSQRKNSTYSRQVPLAKCLAGPGNLRADKWAWMKLAIVVLWVAVSLNTAHAFNGCDAPGLKISPQVCYGDKYYRNHPMLLKDLCNCTKIIGYLDISLITNEGNNNEVLNSFRFPHLREITKYLLMTQVSGLTDLSNMFPNLTVIGGTTLLYHYALVIFNMNDLEYIGLSSLTTILRGAVFIAKNPNLCYVDTVEWGQITKKPIVGNVLKSNKQNCGNCPTKCRKSEDCSEKIKCWGPDHCQNQCENCHENCIGEECCHEECAGGCSSPRNASACVACKHVFHNGACEKACPMQMYKLFDWTCVNGKNCPSREYSQMCDKGCRAERNCYKECTLGEVDCIEECLKKNIQTCASNCTAEYSGMGNVCWPGQNISPDKVQCRATTIENIADAQLLQFCTSIEYLVISISEGDEIDQELSYYLRNIEVIDQYLKIFNTNITSTNILRNLRLIKGQQKIFDRYSLVVMNNPYLNSLDPWLGPNKLIMKSGKAIFQKNPQLCLHQVEELMRSANITDIDEKDISVTSNKNGFSCTKKPLKAYVWPSPEYGILLINVVTKHPQLSPGILYRYTINYRTATENISLPETPCSDIGWLVMEGTVESGRNITKKIKGLVPNTRYAVYVKIYNHKSQAQYSQLIYSHTSPFNPSPPVKLSWAPVSGSELRIWWEPPRHSNGVVDHYMVSAILLPSPPPARKNIRYCDIKDRIQQDSETVRQNSLKRRGDWELKKAKEQPRRSDKGETCEGTETECCDCRDTQKRIPVPQLLHESHTDGNFEDYLISDVRCKQTTKIGGNLYSKCGRAIANEKHGTKFTKENINRQKEREKTRGWKEYNLRNQNEKYEQRTVSYEAPVKNSLHDPLMVEAHSLYMKATKGMSGNHLQPEEQQYPNSDMSNGDTVMGHYQHHNSNASYSIRDPSNSSFVMVHLMTKNMSVILTELMPENLYSISVVACLAPTNCRTSLNRTEKHRQVMPCKLCSNIAANTAAITLATNLDNTIPTQNLTAQLQNVTYEVKLSWEPPKLFNRYILYYDIEFNHQKDKSPQCVNKTYFENQTGEVNISLAQGNYSISVRPRTQVGYGPKSNIVDVVVPESIKADYIPIYSALASICIIVACLAIGCWRIHKSKYDIPATLDNVEYNPSYGGEFATRGMFHDSYLLQRNDLNVFMDKFLGEGHFSRVLYGELKQNGTVTKVAVKTPKDSSTIQAIREFLEEAVVMQNIDCHHIVKFLGVVEDYVPVYIVMELMQGDLKSYLKAKHHPLPTQQILKLAVEAADGMAYLAFHDLVHRDLAARNCLLTVDLTLKISDFGLARNVQNHSSQCYRKEGKGILPFSSMAPESFSFGSYTTKSDVWSYGVLLWEMITKGASPFKGWEMEKVKRLIINERKTLPMPKGCHTLLMNLMKECWRYEPTRRPDFFNIVDLLLKHLRSDFVASFEQVSFFHSTIAKGTSVCRGWELENDWKQPSTNQDTTNTSLQNKSFRPQLESNARRRAVDQCVVSAQVECLLPCHHYPHCPASVCCHPAAASKRSPTETNKIFETSAILDNRTKESNPVFVTNTVLERKPHENSPDFEAITLLESRVKKKTRMTNSPQKTWCSNYNGIRSAHDTTYCCNASDHRIYTNMSVRELPQIPPSLKHLKWQYNSEERVRLIPSLPSSPNEDKEKLLPCEFHGLQVHCKQPWLYSNSVPVCPSHSKKIELPVPKNNILLQPFPIPSSTALLRQVSSNEQVSTLELTPLNHRVMMSAPHTPLSAPLSTNAPYTAIKERLPKVQSSYALLSLSSEHDTRKSTVKELEYLDIFNLNTSTPFLPQRDQGSSVNNATPAAATSSAKSLPKTGVTSSPTSTVLKFTAITTVLPPTSASRPPTTNLSLAQKPSAPVVNSQGEVVKYNPMTKRIPLMESPDRRSSSEFAFSTSDHVEAALPVSLPPAIKSSPTSTSTTPPPPPPPPLHQQQLFSVPPSASTLPKKITSSVLQSDLSSGQSNSSSARQSSSVSRENLTELELM